MPQLATKWGETKLKGDEGERLLDAYYRDAGYVVYEADRQFQGIDRIFKSADGGEITVEYKTDYRAHETGNVFFETKFQPRDLSSKKDFCVGAIPKSHAQYLAYYVYHECFVYWWQMADVKQHLGMWLKKHGPTRTFDGKRWVVGTVVPLRELRMFNRRVDVVRHDNNTK